MHRVQLPETAAGIAKDLRKEERGVVDDAVTKAHNQAVKENKDRHERNTQVHVGLTLVLVIGAGLCSIVAGDFVHSLFACLAWPFSRRRKAGVP
jgi:hypothetical protein